MTLDPKPYAFRSVTWTFTVWARVWAANMRAPARRIPARSEAWPASTPGLSARKTSGRWKLSHTWMKWAALSAASTSTDPAMTDGWLAMMPMDSPPMRASAHTIDEPKSG